MVLFTIRQLFPLSIEGLLSASTKSTSAPSPNPPSPKQIDNLPDELLREVFLGIVQDEFDEHCNYEGPANPWLYPWTFQEVCKRWRRICLNSANLWAYVSLGSWHECGPGRWQWQTEALLATRLQLERSQNTPLFIDGTHICSCRSELTRLRLIATHAFRWATLELNFISLATEMDGLAFLKSFVPEDQVLTSLVEIILASTSCYDGEILFPFTPRNLPHLRRATIYDVYDLDTKDRLKLFPWEHLTELSLLDYRGGTKELLGILSKCANLVNFQFFFDDMWENKDPSASDSLIHDIVSLPHLKYLHLEKPNNPTHIILPRLQAPKLYELEYGDIPPETITTFINFVTPSAKSLTRLTINLPALFHHDYLHILETLPNLRYVYLCHSLPHSEDGVLEDSAKTLLFCNEFLEAMVRKKGASSESSLLPCLADLRLHDLAFDAMILVHMVVSRLDILEDDSGIPAVESASPLAPLEALEISFYDDDKVTSKYYKTVIPDLLGKYVDDGTLDLTI